MPLFTNEITNPTDGALTDTQLRATPVPVSGPLTDTQLRATPVPVSGSVTTGGLTDTQLRATAVPVSGPLTDTQLRATPVPISGTVTVGAPTTLATVTSVAVTNAAAATLSASNAAKKRVVVFNEAGTLYVKLGTAASDTSYTYRLTANTSLEIEEYAGIVTARKASGTTNVLVTEIGI